jgi:Tfp pilus assembly protein PilX
MRDFVDSDKGIGLVLALMMLLRLSLLGAAVLTAATVDLWIGENYRTATQLLYLTESGIEDGREVLRQGVPEASSIPFIKDKRLVDASGREVGFYSVTLTRGDPLTLQSAGVIGNARKTIEVRLMKSGFPESSASVLATPAGAERIVEGILRNATDTFNPASGETVILGSIGSPEDYRVVAVNGDCQFGGAAGYGILLVRGDLTFQGNFTWNGLVLAIGQGAIRVAGPPDTTAGWIEGGVFIARTRDLFGAVLDELGEPVFDLAGNSISVEENFDEIERANRRFPYVPVSYREF